jgi:chromosome segregation ATPase
MAGVLQALSRELADIENELEEIKGDRKAAVQRRKEIMAALLAYDTNPKDLDDELNRPKADASPDLK